MEEKKPRPWYEKVIIVVVLIVVVGVIWGYIHYSNQRQNEQALIYQLKTMRTAIQAYVMSNKSKPNTLQDLASFKFRDASGNVQKINLEGIAKNKDGNFVDPFGNPYVYNITTGRLTSTTTGYENW